MGEFNHQLNWVCLCHGYPVSRLIVFEFCARDFAANHDLPFSSCWLTLIIRVQIIDLPWRFVCKTKQLSLLACRSHRLTPCHTETVHFLLIFSTLDDVSYHNIADETLDALAELFEDLGETPSSPKDYDVQLSVSTVCFLSAGLQSFCYRIFVCKILM